MGGCGCHSVIKLPLFVVNMPPLEAKFACCAIKVHSYQSDLIKVAMLNYCVNVIWACPLLITSICSLNCVQLNCFPSIDAHVVECVRTAAKDHLLSDYSPNKGLLKCIKTKHSYLAAFYQNTQITIQIIVAIYNLFVYLLCCSFMSHITWVHLLDCTYLLQWDLMQKWCRMWWNEREGSWWTPQHKWPWDIFKCMLIIPGGNAHVFVQTTWDWIAENACW